MIAFVSNSCLRNLRLCRCRSGGESPSGVLFRLQLDSYGFRLSTIREREFISRLCTQHCVDGGLVLEWRVEVFEGWMAAIFFGENGFLKIYFPIDAKSFIEDGDAAVSFRVIVVIALVLKDGYVA